MDARFLAVWLMVWVVYRPCSTMSMMPNDVSSDSDEDSPETGDSPRAADRPSETSLSNLPDSTTDRIRLLGEYRGMSDDTETGHRVGSCCQHGSTDRHHGDLMGSQNGHMMGSQNGHMIGRRHWNMMGHYRHMGRWGNRMLHRDHMQGFLEDGYRKANKDGSKEDSKEGSSEIGSRGMMANGRADMMTDDYGVSDEMDDTGVARHRRRHGRPIAQQNNH